ncbi:MAG: nitroreductase family protein [Dehalococcoidia bacterium]|jgi:nitroreductase|nr:nitroreductase family protein [Dehalococcoidia bacterium]MDW8008135.1 nitroreductase family protein [Chloroflexota bacterium]
MDVFEAIYTLRAIRRFKPDPVPDELIWKVLEAATKAPSGGNRQPWRFVVVRDPETKRRIGQFYLEGWERFYGGETRQQMLADPDRARIYRSADYLARHLAEVPVLILACLRAGPGPVSTSDRGSSIFPAVQNLLLAARALGLGGVLTTLHRVREREVRQLLGIPDDWETMALIPLGWPAVPFGPVRRLPVEEVVYWERWGEKRSR